MQSAPSPNGRIITFPASRDRAVSTAIQATHYVIEYPDDGSPISEAFTCLTDAEIAYGDAISREVDVDLCDGAMVALQGWRVASLCGGPGA